MGGNVSEYVADNFRPYSDPTCWGQAVTLHVNPLCTASGPPATRGGSWNSPPFAAARYLRDAVLSATDYNSSLGFRCAK